MFEHKLKLPEADPAAIIPQAAYQALQTSPALVLLRAPGGFGKTTLLSYWARQRQSDSPLAWVRLDRRDRSPLRLTQVLLEALAQLCPDADRQWQNLVDASQSENLDYLLNALDGQLETLTSPAVMILDDLHLLADSRSEELLDLWLEQPLQQLQLVFGSREIPQKLPLARWRIQGRLLEIEADALRWQLAELGAFFREQGFSQTELAAIQAQSHGWVLACQLLKLQLKQGIPLEQALSQLAQHRLLEDYLQQEVLPFVSTQALKFLSETAVLTDLTPASCKALSPEPVSLEQLARELPFLTLMDRRQHWYLCHPLLRDWLQQQLSPTERQAQHARAACYYLTQTQQSSGLEQALEHAIQSEQPEVLADVLQAQAQRLLGLGKIQALQSAFGQLPEKLLQQRPKLAIYQIWIWLLTHELERAADWIEDLSQLPQAEALQGQLANLRGTLARRQGEAEQMIAFSQAALASADPDPFIPACAWFNLGLAYLQKSQRNGPQQLSDWKQAEESLQQAANWNRQAGNLVTHYAARVCQARLYLRQGELEIAKRAYQDILASARQQALQRHSLLGVAQIDLARIAYEQDQLEQATELIEAGLALTRQAYNLDSIYGYTQALEIYLDARELKSVELLLDEALRFAQDQQLPQLWEPLKVYRERLGIFQGKLKAAASEHPRNRLYAALASHQWADSSNQLESLRPHFQGPQLIRLEMLQARLAEAQGDKTAAKQHLSQALRLSQPGLILRAILDEASPGLLSWLPGLATELTSAYRARLLAALSARGVQPEAEALSERERELLLCLAQGLNNKQLEERLFISQNTIKTHLKNLYRKLGASSRTTALARARELGWL